MIRVDPRANETRALRQSAGSFEGLRVLEIGAGDGRLTRRFARQAAHVVALEPDARRYQRRKLPSSWETHVQFLPLSLEDYLKNPLFAGERFDRVLLSWSL
jgi:16S rRNA A1518/A1519 N6-dimethyltransferase RsmA/KsgA/DIM1 with predicted DNA glycosylase/AP lyase activity